MSVPLLKVMPAQAVDTPPKAPLRLQTNPLRPSGERSPRELRLPSNASNVPVRKLWKPRQYRKWESPVLMVLFFVLGLGISMAHCGFYASLEGTIVGSPAEQENNLRLGTAAAFLAQITLGASVWQTFGQWIWRSVKRAPLQMATLNAIFGVETSVLSFLNLDMFRSFKVGYIMALFAWSLILPPFFTPGTLFVYDSTKEYEIVQQVPYLTIANSSQGHYYAFSPSDEGDRFNFKDVLTRVFNGPRTVVTLLSTATASQGEILALKPPSNHSAYTVGLFGPAVQCTQANSSVQAVISELLARKMGETVGTLRETQNAYFAFVPGFDLQGNITAIVDGRYQTPSVATNEVWMAFERYRNSTDDSCDHDKYFQVCSLWNATYDLHLAWDNGFQNVTGSRRLLNRVPYPVDAPGVTSDMAQHAYSAFFWALADQIVGSFGWFQETTADNLSGTRSFGRIQSPIQHNSLLGSSDLAVFFDYNEDEEACQVPYANLSAQRRQDIDLAKNRTLGELVEELSFNITVSFMHNDLFTHPTTRLVTVWESVNRYGYNRTGLWIPYALACCFTAITVVVGVITLVKHGVMPGTKFQDILSAADMHVITIARDPDSAGRSLTANFEGGTATFRPVGHPLPESG